MKKYLPALAILGAFAGPASAQSSVTVYGLIDMSLGRTESDIAAARWTVDSGKWYGSRLGFRGAEDLGNGTSVIFQLENGFSGDTGAIGQSGRLFGRHAWLGLKGDYGQVRFGRAWTPTYCLLTDVLDPFADGMAGAAGAFFGRNIFNAIDIRMENAIFFATTIGGLRSELTYTMGEAAGSTKPGSQIDAAFTHTAGSLKTVLGYHIVNNAAGTGTAKHTFIGGNYNFGPAILHLGVDEQKTELAGATTVDANDVLVALTVPMGGGHILASYNRLDDNTSANVDMRQIAVGYKYDLSKRTTLYTSYGHINLNSASRFNVGIRHRF